MNIKRNGFQKRLFSKNTTLPIAVILAFIGAGFILISLFIPKFNDWSFKLSNVDPSLAANYGGFIGGVAGALFGLVSAILLFLNFRSQERSAARQQFEAKFFEMIRLHRENVSEMTHVDPDSEDASHPKRGRDVFLSIHRQFREIENYCRKKLPGEMPDEEVEGLEQKLIDMAFVILFFGLSRDSRSMLEPYLNPYLEYIELNWIYEYLRREKTRYDQAIVKYGGHQSRLGHYYRHMFQTIKYIDQQNNLSQFEKYDYVRIFRSQLSTYEQEMLFYNSLSQLGKEWKEKSYITKYQLIKNLPKHFLDPINPKKYYPSVKFEHEEL